MPLLDDLAQYLKTVTGVRAEVLACQQAELPLYLKQSYEFRRMQIFGHALTLAMLKEEIQPALSVLVKDWMNLTRILGPETALVLPALKSYERKRLIEKNVPFIVPHRQMYLPMCLVDLRERFSPEPQSSPAHVGWATQLMIIRHLYIADIESRPFTEIARILGYTKMAISKCVEQLSALDLCQVKSVGKTKEITFEASKHDLWKRALPYLRSPIKKEYFVKQATWGDAEVLPAGMTALASLTNLADSSVQTFAMDDKTARRLLSCGGIVVGQDLEEAQCILEGWAYRPGLNGKNGLPDPYSIYLGMRDDPDDRTQMALDEMMEQAL